MRIFHLLIFTVGLSAQSQDLPTRIHFDHEKLWLKSEKVFEYHRHQKWTIFSPRHADFARVGVYYDAFKKVKKLELIIYDANGQRIERIKKKDFLDVSAVEGFEVNDMRYLIYKYETGVYPITLELIQEAVSTQTLHLPSFIPVNQPHSIIDTASYTIYSPLDYKLRYQQVKLDEPVIKEEGEVRTYLWGVSKIEDPVSIEPYGPSSHEYSPRVSFAPSGFYMEKTEGDLTSWSQFGKWCLNLFNSKSELNKDTRELIMHRFGHIKNDRERVTSVYRWMQDRTRYVSIQLGLGGFQPMAAQEVHENGYGDCKALVNYTRSALAVVGITSYPALISWSEEDIDTSFPRQAFNHVVLAVPIQGDTLWLECTNQAIPANYLMPGTTGKHVLLLKEGASQLIKTPPNAQDYTKKIHTTVIASSQEVRYNFSVQGADLARYAGLSETRHRGQKDFIGKMLGGIAEVLETEVNNDWMTGCLQIRSKVIFPKLQSQVGHNLVLTLPSHESALPQLPDDSKRKLDIEFKERLEEIDSILIYMPEDFELEFIPEDTAVKTQFGNYHLSYALEAGQLHCYAKKVLNAGRYPASEYEALRTFLTQMDNLLPKIILMRKKRS